MRLSIFSRTVWFLCALLGCDGLGRAVISEETATPRIPVTCTRKRPVCEPPRPVRLQTEWAPLQGELKPCPIGELTGAVHSGVELVVCELNLALLPDLRELTRATLKSVRILLGPGQQLTLRESALTHVALVSAVGTELNPAGELFLVHSTSVGSVLAAEHMRILSSIVTGSSLHTTQIGVDDLELISSEVSVESGTFAALQMRESALLGCQGGVLIVASNIKRGRIACQGRLQLYTSALDLSSVDGEIEAQTTEFADGTFGLEYPTTLTGWSAGLVNEVLCSSMTQLHASGGELSCSDCEGPIAAGEGDLCVDPERATEPDTNQCEALNALPACDSYPPARRPESVL